MCAVGFLVAADAAAAAKAAGVKALAAGAHVQCKVSKVDKKRKLVTVVAASTTEALKEADGLTLAALMPGTLVAAKVQAVLPDGLLLNFLSCFTVCSALPHPAYRAALQGGRSCPSNGHPITAPQHPFKGDLPRASE